MSDQIPHDPEALRAFMDSLTAIPEASPPMDVPPPAEGEITVRRSISWPADLERRVIAAASERGVSVSQLVRELVELELTTLGDDRPISRADALRALAGVRPLGPAA